MLHLFEARSKTCGVGAHWMGQGALTPQQMSRRFESDVHTVQGFCQHRAHLKPRRADGVGTRRMRPWGIGTRQMPHPLESGDIPAHRTGILPMLHLFEARGETYGVGARWMGQGALAPAGEAMAS